MKEIAFNRGLLLFLIAYFFYIDGVNTIISLATSYGATLGLGSTGMILALLVTQLVAVPFSILFSRLANRFGSITMITAAIAVYFVICGVGFFMGYHLEPYQLEYTALVDEALPEQEIQQAGCRAAGNAAAGYPRSGAGRHGGTGLVHRLLRRR